jgi:uncharacterized small protein (DUF1192 family)
MRKILTLFVLAILISCNQKQAENDSYALGNVEEEMIPVTRETADIPPPPIAKIEKQEEVRKKIIKDGRLAILVSELEKTKSRIDILVKNNGGYYANESFNNSDWESSFNLKIRVPFTNFENLINDIETGDGEIQYKEIEARDVTDQFIDLETRLENKRNYLIRYNDLLKQAKNVNEILEIEEKIRVLEEEIESTTGRLKYLSDLVDYSTLDLTISKKKEFKYNPVNRDKFSERIKLSLSKGWYGFVDFMLFVIKIWPFWILVTLIIYFWRKLKKRKNKK